VLLYCDLINIVFYQVVSVISFLRMRTSLCARVRLHSGRNIGKSLKRKQGKFNGKKNFFNFGKSKFSQSKKFWQYEKKIISVSKGKEEKLDQGRMDSAA